MTSRVTRFSFNQGKHLLFVPCFILFALFVSLLFPSQSWAARGEPGTASCYKFDVRKASRAILFKKTGKPAGTKSFEGSFNLSSSPTPYMLWTGYDSPNDPDFNAGRRDITDTIFTTLYDVYPNWEFDVLLVLRTNSSDNENFDNEWYGYFSEDHNLRVDVYLDFKNGSLSDNPYISSDRHEWDYVGTSELNVPEGEWTLWAYPDDNSVMDNCDYPRQDWPPIELPKPSFDSCDFFPEPLQGFGDNAYADISQTGVSIKGWSEKYVEQYQVQNDQLAIGFDSVTTNEPATCEFGRCVAGGGKLDKANIFIPKPDFDYVSGRLDITQWSDRTQCNNTDACKITGDGQNTVTIDIYKPFDQVVIQSWSGPKFKVILHPDAADKTYGLKIRQLTLQGTTENVELQLAGPGIFTFDQIDLSDGKVSATGKVVAIIGKSMTVHNPIITAQGTTGEVYIYGPEADIRLNGYGQELHARILANRFQLNAGTIYGAVSANDARLAYNSNIVGGAACGPVISQDHSIEITPSSDMSLICGTATQTQTQFSVYTNLGGSQTSGSVTLDIEQADLFDIDVSQGYGTYPNYMSNSSGILTLSLTPKQADKIELGKAYQISASLNIDPEQKAVSHFQYVPYKFEAQANPIEVVAGKPEPINVKVLACDASYNPVEINYNNDQVSSQHQWISPANGEGVITYSPQFDNGTAQDPITVDNVGHFKVSFQDDNFDCQDLIDCPIDGKGKLSGEVDIISRPFAFAICDSDSKYLPSVKVPFSNGEAFSLKVKPVAWQAGDPDPSTQSAIDVQNFCSRPATTNFFASDAFNTKVTLTQIKQDSGDFDLVGELEKFNTQIMPNESALSFANVINTNVGQLTLNADAPYYSSAVNRSQVNIGYFYPYKLGIADIDFVNQDPFSGESQNTDFSHMNNQHNQFNADIRAYNIDGIDVSEAFEQRFSDELRPKLRWLAKNKADDKDLFDLGRMVDTDGREFPWSPQIERTIYATRLVTSTEPYTTTPDGPFNRDTVEFGFESNGLGNVNFMPDASRVLGERGEELPYPSLDFRYGRIKLDNNIAQTGKPIMVSARLEHWDGMQFVLTKDDRYTKLDISPNDVCVNGNISGNSFWVTPQPAAYFYNYYGKIEAFSVAQQAPSREQATAQLKLSNQGEDCLTGNYDLVRNAPHLTYNWRNKGDENPIANLLFGYYRGSDRVIFRGENVE